MVDLVVGDKESVSRLQPRLADQKNVDVVILVNSAEPPRSWPSVTQCFRCQMYEYARSHCTANIKCLSCGDEHFSQDCSSPREQPTTCANCGELCVREG